MRPVARALVAAMGEVTEVVMAAVMVGETAAPAEATVDQEAVTGDRVAEEERPQPVKIRSTTMPTALST